MQIIFENTNFFRLPSDCNCCCNSSLQL